MLDIIRVFIIFLFLFCKRKKNCLLGFSFFLLHIFILQFHFIGYFPLYAFIICIHNSNSYMKRLVTIFHALVLSSVYFYFIQCNWNIQSLGKNPTKLPLYLPLITYTNCASNIHLKICENTYFWLLMKFKMQF